jgi:acetyl-CoA carboxylase, biotin carboxylase subunit
VKVLVANRGEIAVRIVRACRELGLPSVAVHSDADADALHVRLADEAVAIGPAPAASSYLNVDAVLDATAQTGADAVHPGYGFLAENASFAAACAERGLVFVGPSAATIEEMGNKAAARRLAQSLGVPTVPGSDGVVAPEDCAAVADEIGYPVLLKAAGGGGGRGIRVVAGAAELEQAVAEAAREAQAAFGDPSLYVEKLLVDPRHVEVQLLADTHGNVVHLFERECSIQRRRQKLVEESPAPLLDPHVRTALAEAAVTLARAIGYVGAGTVEFLLDGDDYYFIETNTRVQVEHPVTEMVTGIDIVKEQLRVAMGEPLSFADGELSVHGSAIEFRINAEDPERDFFPSPGTVDALHLPGGPGVRVDTALFAGATVPPFYDSLVAKLVVWGRTRDEALDRARRALDELRIDGIRTTTSFHRQLLEDSRFLSGAYDTGFLSEVAAS